MSEILGVFPKMIYSRLQRFFQIISNAVLFYELQYSRNISVLLELFSPYQQLCIWLNSGQYAFASLNIVYTCWASYPISVSGPLLLI
jgi:hypothetical protein